MKQLKFLLVLVATFAGFAVPAAAGAATIQTTPPQSPGFAGTNTFYLYNDSTVSAWKSLMIDSSDGLRYNLAWSFDGAASFPKIQWSDGSQLAAGEMLDTWSRLRFRVERGSRGVGTYDTNLRLSNADGDNGRQVTNSPYLLPVRMVIEPHNECTDRVDNDGDGKMDWRPAFFGISVDTDCTDMNDTTEGGAPPPPPEFQCSNGFDDLDPEDTLADYPADPGCSSATDNDETDPAPPPPPPVGSWWKPAKTDGPWDWQLTGALNTTRANTVNVLDVDPDNVTAGEIAAWKAARPAGAAHAICYVSAGTAENFRADYQQFVDIDAQRRKPVSEGGGGDPNGILGGVLPEWQDERWLDGQDFQYFQHLIAARVDKCVADGFDAVEFDNVDGYTNDPQTLTASEQLTYNRALAGLAHEKGLAAFLKNDVDQLTALQPDFDGAINEQCAQFAECDGYSVFTAANKPVLQAEYGTKNTTRCNQANTAGRWAAYYALALSGTTRYEKCWL